jgi:hypothetical protein
MPEEVVSMHGSRGARNFGSEKRWQAAGATTKTWLAAPASGVGADGYYLVELCFRGIIGFNFFFAAA